jgi:formylglycine-generating enzyme
MRKKALLIGINAYKLLGELKYARQDAESVAEALCRYSGFTERDITVISCRGEGGKYGLSNYIERALDRLLELKELDLLVFGFWGHGFSPRPGVRYLCGIETDKEDLERTAVSLDIVQAKLAQAQAENTLVLLDCCQNTPGRSVQGELMSTGEEAVLDSLARDIQVTHKARQKGIIPTVAILNSCSEGERAYEWQSRGHGVFTAHLLDSFKEGLGSIALMAPWIAERVAETSEEMLHQKQTPYVIIKGKGNIPLVAEGRDSAKAYYIKPPEKKTEPYWWLVVEGKETGPFEEREILEKISSKELNRGCDCWREGMESWQPIGQTEEWGKLFPPERKEAKVITPPRRRIEPSSEIIGKDGAPMMLVPSGEFVMGSPKGEGSDDEHPQHKVYLDAYHIDKYPVTVKQYKRYCDETGKDMPYEPDWGWKDEHPIVNVTWEEAVEYAEYYGKRLPTEAEWEKACRAGSETEYCFGDNEEGLGAYGWFEGNAGKRTHPVGQKKPNAWGIYDMHGNVWEWCSDWYGKDYYKSSPGENPQGPVSGEYRVLRGGGWIAAPNPCRSANRGWDVPALWVINLIGFRCVASAAQ